MMAKAQVGSTTKAAVEELAVAAAAPAAAEAAVALFSKIDADGSGDIDKDEMKTALKQTAKEAGRDLTDAMVTTEVDNLFKEFDVDKNGTVDKAEFVAMMAKAQVGSTTKDAVEVLAAAAPAAAAAAVPEAA